MRNLQRDTQPVWIARYVGVRPGRDEQGRYTGKPIPTYDTPEVFYPSISLTRGESQGAYFGADLDYDRVITYYDPDFEVGEADRLWIDKSVGDLENPDPHDFVIKRVSRKGDLLVLAVKHVEVSK